MTTTPKCARLWIQVVVLLLLAMLAGCDALRGNYGAAPAGALYHCNEVPFDLAFPFDPELVGQPGTAEKGDDPRSVALRAFLGPGGRKASLPELGWHLIGTEGNRAEFVARTDSGFVSVRLVRWETGWAVEGSGGCEPELVMAGGVRAADWQMALDAPVDRTSTSITVLVREHACASGELPGDRIAPPTIVREPKVIRIAFGVVPLPGAQDCHISPQGRVVVDLGEAIGDRVISDFGIWPPINEWAEAE